MTNNNLETTDFGLSIFLTLNGIPYTTYVDHVKGKVIFCFERSPKMNGLVGQWLTQKEVLKRELPPKNA